MIKKIILSIVLLMSLNGCALLVCEAICDSDPVCYTLCSGDEDPLFHDEE